MKLKIELKWAFIFMIMQLLWMTMEKLTGLHDVNLEYHPLVSMFVAIPSILIYVLALLDKRRKDYGGYMTYGQGFMCGFWITVFVTLVSPLTIWLTMELISPDFFRNIISYSVLTKMMTTTEAEAYFNLKSYIIQTLIFTPVMGIFTTLIVAAFTMRKRRDAVS